MPQPLPTIPLKPVVVSAPFGNYVQPKGATPTLGTFTAAARPGRLLRIIKTVRYYPRLKAWVNKIGLRNPGIDWLTAQVNAGRKELVDKLVSIHGFNDSDWYKLIDAVAEMKPMGVELNMSCPNVGHIDWPEDLFERAVGSGVPVVMKLPPVNYQQMLEQAVAAGVRVLHCCNTLPVPAGGVSGKPLFPVSLAVIRDIRSQPFGNGLTIIGGGGVYHTADIDAYFDAGANHIALGTKVMHPKYLLSDAGVRPLIQHASDKLNDAG